jgi:predicted nuclease of restriction endonuclease-like (RecB) superfamily
MTGAPVAQRLAGRLGFGAGYALLENEAVLRGIPCRFKTRTMVRVLLWTHNLLILSQSKGSEEPEFYLKLAVNGRLSKRELERQLRNSAFERTMLSDLKLASVVRVLHQNATGVFKDSYLVDFLDLPETHSEPDLQKGLQRNLRKFLMELGDEFAFVGEKVRVQVGNQDFELDLLFYHRDLQCLVAFELKTSRFESEHMGKPAFYLEALDRDRKRAHEYPSIGVLLCRTKDDEVVEYAMNLDSVPRLPFLEPPNQFGGFSLAAARRAAGLYCSGQRSLYDALLPNNLAFHLIPSPTHWTWIGTFLTA